MIHLHVYIYIYIYICMTYYRYVSIAITTTHHPIEKLQHVLQRRSSTRWPALPQTFRRGFSPAGCSRQRWWQRWLARPPRHDWRGKGLVFGGFDLQKLEVFCWVKWYKIDQSCIACINFIRTSKHHMTRFCRSFRFHGSCQAALVAVDAPAPRVPVLQLMVPSIVQKQCHEPAAGMVYERGYM